MQSLTEHFLQLFYYVNSSFFCNPTLFFLYIFSALVIDSEGKQCIQDLPFQPLLQTAAGDKDTRGRVSTGTKFALEEWLQLKS